MVKLKPKGPFTRIPRATTIFGAISNAIRLLYGRKEVEKFIAGFINDDAKITSAFPYDGETYFLPKPLSVDLVVKTLFETKKEDVKKVKKKDYIPLESFEKALRLEEFEVKELPYKVIELPKVSLDRVSNDSSLYFWDLVTFKENSGLYFLYDGSNKLFEKYIVPAMRLLEDQGIGGKGTWGYGLFEVEIEELEIEEPRENSYVTLSPFVPENETSLILWKIVKLGGWSQGKRRPKIPMVVEGSLSREDRGKMITLDLSLSYPVYVYARSFLVRASLPEEAVGHV
ncbi:284aa long hypothetical protein [Pyrococcus horikoshii OT3]|uniref:CRISPR system Cms protein Csm4 n=1 Tax=Pyrococcus horikoshii (strain ATCC 700860 / DSM 12428 / JCM 9974 / NBRC 100139 / OT-3) TaxID=70601 RepID=O57905_PYRHO|nr:284aa long hypothetical protein [Pyrococcus horikoshii OT3]